LDCRRGRNGRGSVTGQSLMPFPDPIDRLTYQTVARTKLRKTAAGGGHRGSTTSEAQWPIGPGDGLGNCCPRRTPLDNRSTPRADGQVKRRAAAGSLAPWCTCQNAGVEHDGEMRLPIGPWMPVTGIPQVHRRTRPDDWPTSRAVGTFDVCCNAALNSGVSSCGILSH